MTRPGDSGIISRGRVNLNDGFRDGLEGMQPSGPVMVEGHGEVARSDHLANEGRLNRP
jgi:hypothetical protein